MSNIPAAGAAAGAVRMVEERKTKRISRSEWKGESRCIVVRKVLDKKRFDAAYIGVRMQACKGEIDHGNWNSWVSFENIPGATRARW